MRKTLATLSLALALSLPLSARADDNPEKLAAARTLVEKTILKSLDTGFSGALEKTVAAMPDDRAEALRKQARVEFDTQRKTLLDGVSKSYAERFSLDELKHLQGIYDDPVYQKFQAINADPKSEANLISQAAVTRLLNLLTLAAAGEQQGGAPGGMPAPAK